MLDTKVIKSWSSRALARLVGDHRPIILRYHRVLPEGERPFYNLGIPKSIFARHIEWLSIHRNFVKLQQIVDWLSDGVSLPERAVALTFDDGYRDNLTEAFPTLVENSAPATIFLISHLIDERRFTWWDQLAFGIGRTSAPELEPCAGLRRPLPLTHRHERETAIDLLCEKLKLQPNKQRIETISEIEEALGIEAPEAEDCPLLSWDDVQHMQEHGIDFGSHTCSHPILSRLPSGEAWQEIIESKKLIETRLGRRIRHFSYPNGKRDDWTPELERLVQRAGYECAVTTIEGPLRPGAGTFALPRKGVTEATLLDVTNTFSADLLKVELSGFYDTVFLRRWRDRSIH